jgi:hypothetical protein
MEHMFRCVTCANGFHSTQKDRKYCSRLCFQRNQKYRFMKRERDELFWRMIKVAWFVGSVTLLIITMALYWKLNTLRVADSRVADSQSNTSNMKLRDMYASKKIIPQPNKHKDGANKQVHA